MWSFSGILSTNIKQSFRFTRTPFISVISVISRFIQTSVKVICRSEAEADNADRGLNNSDILRKPNSILLLLFIRHEKSAMRIQIKNK